MRGYEPARRSQEIRILEQLSERCRKLIQLLYFDSKEPSYIEIGQTMGMPQASIGPTRARCLEKLRKLIDHLRGLGHERFVLTGSCFDARTALSAFDNHAARIDGLLFIAAPVTSIDDQQRLLDQGKDWGHMWRALQNPENWRRLRDLDRWRHMANVLGRVAGRGAREDTPAAEGPPLDPLFRRNLDALARSSARALFLYGEDDPEFLGFQIALRELWSGFSDETRARLAVEVWPGLVHSGFIEMTRQREILARALEWLLDLAGHPAGAANGADRADTSRSSHHRPEGTWTSA